MSILGTPLRGGLCGAVAGALVTFAAMHGLGDRGGAAESTSATADARAVGSPLPGQSPAELAEVVAQFDGVTLTVGQLQQELNAQVPAFRIRYQDPTKKKAFVDNLIRSEVQRAEALRRRLDRDPEVVRAANQIMIKRLLNAVEREVTPAAVSDVEMRAYYEAHVLEFNTPAKVRTSAIVLQDRALADQVAKAAKTADLQAFRELVAKHSVDEASRPHGGDLQYFAIDATTVPREVVTAAFALVRTGDVAGAIATKQGFFVIQQTGRLPAVSHKFEDVRDGLRQRLYGDKVAKAVDEFITALVTRAKVTLHEPALAKIRVDTSDVDP